MNHKILALLLTIVLGIGSASFAQTARESTHIVLPGETLAVIAARYEVDIYDLAAVNDIYNTHRIYSWQELKIPSLSDEDAPIVGNYRSHVIRDGETLREIAERYGVDLHELNTLNDLYGKVINPGHELQLPLPADSGASVYSLSNEAPLTTQGRQHVVKYGETLGTIAAAYGVNLNELILVNGVFDHVIYAGQTLTLPDDDGHTIVEPAVSEPEPEGPPPGDYIEHRIQYAETLGKLAIRYGVTVQDLQEANNIAHPNHINAGRRIWIPATSAAARDVADVEPAPNPDPPAAAVEAETAETAEPATEGPPPGDYIEHRIQYAETLGKLAIRYGVTVQDLQEANNIAHPSHIIAGQQLWIPATSGAEDSTPDDKAAPDTESQTAAAEAETAESPAETAEPAPEGPAPGDYIEHTIQYAETLGILAIRHGVTVQDLQEANNIPHPSRIIAGQQLRIPVTSGSEDSTPDDEAARAPEPLAAAVEAETAESPAETGEDAPEGPAPGEYFEHTIQLGETLGVLAIHYGLTVQDLRDANNIGDSNLIKSGQSLWIPASAKRRDPPPPPELPEPDEQAAVEVAPERAAPAPQAQSAPVVAGNRQQYVVRKGDFLTQLGIDLDTSWIALAKLNNLEAPYNLHIGSTLLIPERADVELYDPKYAAWKWFDIIGNQPGPRVGVGREIVVLLDAQAIYAYENGALQKAVRVSTGKRATPTVKGDHKIWLKRRSQTMSGPGYSLPNVEWVMFFYRDYAIHGTWWHTNFGQPMSHGCVNLTNADAQWFYEFASIDTPVHVR